MNADIPELHKRPKLDELTPEPEQTPEVAIQPEPEATPVVVAQQSEVAAASQIENDILAIEQETGTELQEPSDQTSGQASGTQQQEGSLENIEKQAASSEQTEASEITSSEKAAGSQSDEARKEGSSSVNTKSSAPVQTQPVLSSSSIHSGIPGAPGIPGKALAGGDDDDDDIDIPEAVDYGHIVRTSSRKKEEPSLPTTEAIHGTIAGIRDDGYFVDIGRKSEAFLPIAPNASADESYALGSPVKVVIAGQSSDGYLLLQGMNAMRPTGWEQLATAFASDATVVGRVIEQVKSGLTVDVGVRAFMPASRSGERHDDGLQALIGQDIRARIIKLDEYDKNVVLDRRVVLEEERSKKRRETLSTLKEGDHIKGVVKSLRDFGAFVDLGGFDGLLHITDIAWNHISTPADILHIEQEIEVQVLKIDQQEQRIKVGLKQLQPEPWTNIGDTVKPNEVIRGRVTRIKDFGAFVEIAPGVEGLIHLSELSYDRRVRYPGEIVKTGDFVEVMVLDVQASQKRIGLSLKQALGNPWLKVSEQFPVNSVITGTVRKIVKFGAFIEITKGIDGLLHISDITSEKHLMSPTEMLREGQQVRVKVMEINPEKQEMKLGMKQLEPTELDSVIAQINVGDRVTGRVIKTKGRQVTVEIGEGVHAFCKIQPKGTPKKSESLGQTSDLSSLRSMLEEAWHGDGDAFAGSSEGSLTPGSVHTFKITRLDKKKGIIELATV